MTVLRAAIIFNDLCMYTALCLHVLAFIELAADVELLATTYREVELAIDVHV